MDHARSRGTKCEESIVASLGMRKLAEGSRIFDPNEIVSDDHSARVVDVSVKECFKHEFS